MGGCRDPGGSGTHPPGSMSVQESPKALAPCDLATVAKNPNPEPGEALSIPEGGGHGGVGCAHCCPQPCAPPPSGGLPRQEPRCPDSGPHPEPGSRRGASAAGKRALAQGVAQSLPQVNFKSTLALSPRSPLTWKCRASPYLLWASVSPPGSLVCIASSLGTNPFEAYPSRLSGAAVADAPVAQGSRLARSKRIQIISLCLGRSAGPAGRAGEGSAGWGGTAPSGQR